MILKKTLFILSTACVLLASSCTGEYYDRIDSMKVRVAALEEQCALINANIVSIRTMVEALQSKDLITGVSDVVVDKQIVGYKINFVHSGSITIYDGISGSVPYLGTKQKDGIYYWTIQYGSDGDVEFLTDENGDYIQAIATVPFLKISNDDWLITYDSGKSWQNLGKATGEDADTMVSKVTVTNDYVIFKMADGTEYKFPTYSSYTALQAAVRELNDNARSQQILIDTELIKLTWITKVEPIMDGQDSVGTYIELSNGQSCSIRDWRGSNVPVVRAVLDTSDSNYYWAVQYGEEPYEWVIAEDGKRILALDSSISIPQIGIDSQDGQFYWTVTCGDSTTFVKKKDGSAIVASDGCFAKDSTQISWFKQVVDTEDYLYVTMLDGMVVKIPHLYAIEYALDSVAVAGSVLVLPQDSTFKLTYKVTGGTVKDLVVMTEGSIKAVSSLSQGSVSITTGKNYHKGALTLLFTFGEAESTNTKIKKFQIQQ